MKWLLLDGFNLAFRSFYAIPELTRSDGFPTNALHGWVRTLWKLADDEAPDRMAVFFDLEGSARHLEELPDYKAQRKEMPEPLSQQLPCIKDLTRLMGLTLVEKSTVEADDLIAAAARRLSAAGNEVWIVSADKDLAQCVGDNVRQLLPAPTANPKIGWRKLDREGVIRKFGVPPERIPDYLALIGDTSDNIPGIAGVGPKTASKWITQYGGLENVIAAASEIRPPRFQSALTENTDRLRLNLRLITADPGTDPGGLAPGQADPKGLADLLERMEMKTLAREVPQRYPNSGG